MEPRAAKIQRGAHGDVSVSSSTTPGAPRPALPGVSNFQDAVPYPAGHPLSGTAYDLSWKKYKTHVGGGGYVALSHAQEGGGGGGESSSQKPSAVMRAAGDLTWEDPSLAEWDPSDFRLFVSNIGHDVTTEMLADRFGAYPSTTKCKVVFDKLGHSKGFGFVSFSDPEDYLKAFTELNGKYVGSRAIKLEKSSWKDRDAIHQQLKAAKKPVWLR